MQNNNLNPEHVIQFAKEFGSKSSLQQKLESQGWEEEAIQKCIIEFEKVKRSQRSNSGFMYGGIGGFVGFVSCLLSISNPIPDLHAVFLYGLTSVSILLVVYGMYLIFE